MIPAFPHFKPLTIEDKAAFEDITHTFEPYSDFNFVSAFVWDTTRSHQIAELNGNLVLILADYANHTPVLSFLGCSETDNTALELLDFAEGSLGISSLTLVPESTITHMQGVGLTICEDRDNFDYIFRTDDLVHLPGGRYRSKRKAISRFQKQYAHSSTETRLLTSEALQEIRSVLVKWNESKKDDVDHDRTSEITAITKAVAHGEECKLSYTSLLIDGAIAGFSIDEVLPAGYAMSHFIKTDIRYTGVTEYLNMRVAERLLAEGVRYWNWEQDLGIPNLRLSKMLYAPCSFLKKYTITRS